MSRYAGLSAALFSLLLSAPGPGVSRNDALIGEADAAFAGGNYALAEELYGRAEPRASDPGRVTLGLAGAKYRLAADAPARGSATLLNEAAELYRYCLAVEDWRRGTALVGLGNCLLRSAGNRDAAAAWAAAERFAEADRETAGTETGKAARHNLMRARLIARQIATIPADTADKPPAAEPEPDRKPPQAGPRPQEQADDPGGKKSGARPEAVPGEQAGAPSGESPLPGKGELPPVPDQDGLPPLTATQAREHLEQAARRIMEEGRQHRRNTSRTAPTRLRDW